MRKWNEKGEEKHFTTGKFSDEETKLIQKAICEYCREKGVGVEGLTKLVSDARREYMRAWNTIAECLPDRSVQSIHNFCRRKFNPKNY
jgi:hypothetical protein